MLKRAAGLSFPRHSAEEEGVVILRPRFGGCPCNDRDAIRHKCAVITQSRLGVRQRLNVSMIFFPRSIAQVPPLGRDVLLEERIGSLPLARRRESATANRCEVDRRL